MGTMMVLFTSAAAGLVRPDDARADIADQGAGYVFHYFADSDHVQVYSHYLDYVVELENNAQVLFEWNNELVVIPPVEAAPGSDEAADAITSASRPVTGDLSAFEPYEKNRDVIKANARYGQGQAGYYVSIEEDYLAQQVSGGINFDFVGQTTNLAAASSYGWDSIEPLVDDDTPGGDDRRTNVYFNLVLTQVLTAKTVLRIGGELNLVNGLQHSPYRNVYAGGSAQPELHPGNRNRQDFFIKMNRYFDNRSSVNVSYKYYTDDWGVDSHTIGARLNQYISHDVLVRYRYRYYEQGGAWFFLNEYPLAGGVDGYLSGDYRLDAFTAHLFGTTLDWGLGGMVGSLGRVHRPRLVVKYERYFNSNNFSANIFESGLAVNF